MRVAKVRHARSAKPSFLLALALMALVGTMARYPPLQRHAFWTVIAALSALFVLILAQAVSMAKLSARRARRQKDKLGGYSLKGGGADWRRFDGEFAVVGGPGYRARLRYVDLVDARLDRYDATIRGFILGAPGPDGAVNWSLRPAKGSARDGLEALDGLLRHYQAWCEAPISGRASVMPPMGYPAWHASPLVASLVMVAAFLIPIPGLDWRAPSVPLLILPLCLFRLRTTRRTLRKAGWTFDDERPQPNRRPRGVA